MPRVSDAVAVAARAVAPAAWRVSLAAARVSLAAVARVRRAVAGDVADVVRRPAARMDVERVEVERVVVPVAFLAAPVRRVEVVLRVLLEPVLSAMWICPFVVLLREISSMSGGIEDIRSNTCLYTLADAGLRAANDCSITDRQAAERSTRSSQPAGSSSSA